jgi:pilus assembly protein CpaD
MIARFDKDIFTMVSSRSTAALLVLGLSAAACGPVNRQAVPLNPTVYSVNQPVVQRTDYVLDLATTGDGVPASELGRLGAWFQSLQLGYGDRIFVDQSQGYADGRVRNDIGSIAGNYGLLLAEGAPMTAGAVQPGQVRVIVSRTTASVPGCPNWGAPNQTGGSGSTSPNFGCAINSNLAAMIADPNDLVLGQAGSVSGDPATSSRAIRTYRTAPQSGTRGLTPTPTTGGRQ